MTCKEHRYIGNRIIEKRRALYERGAINRYVPIPQSFTTSSTRSERFEFYLLYYWSGTLRYERGV